MMQHGEIIPIKMKMKLFPRIAGYGVDNDGKFTISVRDFTRKRGLSARLNFKGRMGHSEWLTIINLKLFEGDE